MSDSLDLIESADISFLSDELSQKNNKISFLERKIRELTKELHVCKVGMEHIPFIKSNTKAKKIQVFYDNGKTQAFRVNYSTTLKEKPTTNHTHSEMEELSESLGMDIEGSFVQADPLESKLKQFIEEKERRKEEDIRLNGIITDLKLEIAVLKDSKNVSIEAV